MNRSSGTILRCYGKYRGGWWYLYCVDLCLATRRRTLAEAQASLKEDIIGYLHAAKHPNIADALRRPPLKSLIEYYLIWINVEILHATRSLLTFDWRYTSSGLRPANA